MPLTEQPVAREKPVDGPMGLPERETGEEQKAARNGVPARTANPACRKMNGEGCRPRAYLAVTLLTGSSSLPESRRQTQRRENNQEA